MRKVILPQKEVSSVSRGVAVGGTYEGKGFASFFDESGKVYEELVFDEPADFVSCEEDLCAIYSGGKVYMASTGSVLKSFEVDYPASWVLLKNDKVIVTHDEGVTAYSLEGKRLWKLPYGPTRGAAEVKGLIYAGTQFGMIAIDINKGKLVKEVELGTGNWRVTSSCGSALLAVDDENAIALTLLTIKDLGEPEPAGKVPNVVGTPWISPDCLYVAVPKCGVSVHDAEGHEVFSDVLEADECVGVWAFWDEELLVGVNDEGLWTSYVLFYEYPFKIPN